MKLLKLNFLVHYVYKLASKNYTNIIQQNVYELSKYYVCTLTVFYAS